MRIILIIASIIGFVLTGLLALLILVWDGLSSVSLVVWGGGVGFAVILGASILIYHRDWYRNVAVFGAVLLSVYSYCLLQDRMTFSSMCIMALVIMVLIDAYKNH